MLSATTIQAYYYLISPFNVLDILHPSQTKN